MKLTHREKYVFKNSEVGLIPEDWNSSELSNTIIELTDFVAAGSFESLRNNVTVYEGHEYAFYVRLYDIRLGLGHKNQKYVDKKSYDFLKRSNLNGDEVLIANIGANVGETFLMPKVNQPATIAPNMIVIRTDKKKLLPSYLLYYSKSDIGREKLFELISGSGHPKVNKTDLKKLFLLLPPLKEQEAIAEALSDADDLIRSLDALIEKKQAIKNGTMQQLLTGKKRLPGFSGEWEVKRLGDLLTVMHGKSQKTVENAYGQYPILATSGVIGKAYQFLYDKPSVLIGRKGTINKPQYMDSPFWTIDTLFYTQVKKPALAKFLYYKFLMINWESYNEASGVPSLNSSTIENIEIVIPNNIKEQQSIVKLLDDLNHEIQALQQKRDKYKQIKQGMMQELLTGKTRLI